MWCLLVMDEGQSRARVLSLEIGFFGVLRLDTGPEPGPEPEHEPGPEPRAEPRPEPGPEPGPCL